MHRQLNELIKEKDMLTNLHVKLVQWHSEAKQENGTGNQTALEACSDVENLLGKLAILDIDVS